MHFSLISLFPEAFNALLENGVIAGAYKKGLFQVSHHNPRDFVTSNYKSVDDEPYGGGDGMVMSYEPLKSAIAAAKAQNPRAKIVYLSPAGSPWSAKQAETYAKQKQDLILIAGRYAGIDQRIVHQYVDEEISIGDYVVSGGELPAMILMDSILRHLPGVLGNLHSAKQDSFQAKLLEAPSFTRPEHTEGLSVPKTLLSGHHGKISQWRMSLQLLLTMQRRPDLLRPEQLSLEQQKLCKVFWQSTPEKERKLLGLEERFPWQES
tara:strand:- start:6630 stop:7421 length:792 start_codon:yes stop_codon:yes gene_type:complete